MTIWFALLILGAYLLGSMPTSYIVARLFHGIDLRQHGTGQVGGGNLWRMTSWKLGLPVGLFDVSKGLVMVWVTESVGLGIAQQIIVGLAVIIGHNWPVFLRFSGGRGLGITMGVVLILPLINDMTLWPSATFFAILIIGTLVLRSSPLPALTAAASLSPASWMFHETIPVTMGFLAIFLAIVISRLAAAHSADSASVSKKRLLVNRLFFDRDIEDRMDWMYRNPAKKDERGKAD